MITEYALGDIVQMKKDHPCKKSSYWEIVRVGTDIIMMERREFERKCKKLVHKASEQ